MQMSFAEMMLTDRVPANNMLKGLLNVIDWNALRPDLQKLYKRDVTSGGGQIPYDELVMFKATLLGHWYNLSDRKLEESLHVRIDFMQFCGLSLSAPVPDATTLGRFRGRLREHNRFDVLLKAVNAQLQIRNLMVKADGAIVDASVIPSAARPNRVFAGAKDENGEPVIHEDGSQPGVVRKVKESADPDATWTRKGKKSSFGYKAYPIVDVSDSYVRGVHMAPANENETKHLERVLDSADLVPEILYADKGYASQANRTLLEGRDILDGIMHKATRGSALEDWQKEMNREISKDRYRVEQCFGTLKRLFGMTRASYMGLKAVKGQFVMKCIAYNLLKAVNKVRKALFDDGAIRPANGVMR